MQRTWRGMIVITAILLVACSATHPPSTSSNLINSEGRDATAGTPMPKPSPTTALASTEDLVATQVNPYLAEEEARKYPAAPPPKRLSRFFQQEFPGTPERRCVDTQQHRVIRSGEFVAGDFRSYIERWRPDWPPGQGKLWWAPLHQDQMSEVKIRAAQLDNDPNKTFTYHQSTVAGNEDGLFYPTSIELPTTGRWRLIATSGPDWGCFDVVIDER